MTQAHSRQCPFQIQNPSQTIIVIGGLSAGPSAAAKARREDENAQILMFEKSKYISYATCGIPYAMSGVIQTREKLMVVQPELFEKRFNIEMHLEEEVLSVNIQNKTIQTAISTYSYDKLVIATGASPIIPTNFENLEQSQNWSGIRTLEDYDRVNARGILKQSKKVTILGAGLIGVELAENLVHKGYEVTIIEGATHVLPLFDLEMSALAQKVMEQKGIRVITGQFAKNIQVRDQNITGVILENEVVNLDFLFITIGIRPNTSLVREQLECLPNGALLVNEQMQTSHPDVYAAGDCASIPHQQSQTPGYFPLGTHSNKGGRTAGANVARSFSSNTTSPEKFKGAYGTAIIQVFEYTLAKTGYNEAQLIQNQIPYLVSLIHAGATPGYYPGAKENTIKLFYAPDTGLILGAQIWGEVGADKRIDVLSTAIYAKLTVEDLPNIDFAYAPPYAPAKDPIIVAAYQAQNHRRSQVESTHKIAQAEEVILDVRNPSEVELGHLGAHKFIPLDELRTRLNELDKNKKITVYCQKGLRGYLASRILKSNGFKVKNLQGGYKTHEPKN